MLNLAKRMASGPDLMLGVSGFREELFSAYENRYNKRSLP